MAHYWLGKCHKFEFEHGKVIAIYSELLRESPEWSIVACELGLSYEEIGDTENAIKCFEHVLKLTKRNAVAYYHLGKMYQKNGNLIKAIETYRAGLKLYPKSELLTQCLDYVTSIDMP